MTVDTLAGVGILRLPSRRGERRLPDIESVTGLSRSTIDRLEAKGAFPRRRRIGPHCTGWLASEVAAWLESRPVEACRRPGGTEGQP